LKLEMQKLPETELSTEKAIVRRQIHLKPYYEKFASPVHYRPNTPLAKMFYFVRRHPVAVTMSSFAMFGLVGWILNDTIRSFSGVKKITDINPVSYYLNNSTGYLEIKNKENQNLWGLASNRIGDFSKQVGITQIQSAVVTDINDDGKNEILTILPSPGDETDKRNLLHIYSSDQKPLQNIPFGRAIKYRDRQYQNEYSCDGVMVDGLNSGNKEIFVLTKNNRSPSIVTRLDKNGTILGEYWHFGYINDLYALDVNNDGKKEIVLCGFNDVADINHQEFPMITVLNPEKVVGEIESQCTPGFGLTKSEAEYFYVQLPRSDMDNILSLTTGAQGIAYVDDKILRLTTVSTLPDNRKFYFDYIFSHDLRPVQVKSNNKTDQIRYDLVKQNKITGTIDQAYLDNLKNGIRYWDGKEWRKEWTMVKHSHN